MSWRGYDPGRALVALFCLLTFGAFVTAGVYPTQGAGGGSGGGVVTGGDYTLGTVLFENGLVGAPSISFANDTDTGWYLASAGSPRLSVAGSDALTVGAGTLDVASQIRVDDGSRRILFAATSAKLRSSYAIRWNDNDTASGGTEDVALVREASGILGIENVNGAGWHIATASEELTALSGASASTTNLVPAGGRILNVVVRVTTTITGATSFDIGDGSDVDRYGATIALTAGTTTDHSDATADPMSWSAAAQDVTLTANGSNFTGGAVRVVATYLAAEPPGS